jgi:hypothetical protein
MAIAELTTPADEEATAVLEWRFSQLKRSGFAAVDALVLAARSDIDLHSAAALMARGCPPSLALRILL